MNRVLERQRDLFGGIAFVVFVIVLIVGGFFLTRYLTSEKEHIKVLKNEIDKYKLDASKDLVYYENETIVSAEPDIVHKDIVINLKEASTINEILKEEMESSIRNSIKKISESEIDPNRELLFNKEDIFSAKERNRSSVSGSQYSFSVFTIRTESGGHVWQINRRSSSSSIFPGR